MSVADTRRFRQFARQLIPSLRRRKLRRRLLQPLRNLRTAWRAAAADGAGQTAGGLAPLRQFFKLWRLSTWHGYSLEECHRFRMHRLPMAQAVQFIPQRENIAARNLLYQKLGVDTGVLADKRRFYRICQAAGLPVPETVADAADGEVHWWGAPHLPPCSLFAKEAASMRGAGARRWDPLGDDRWRASDGGVCRGPDLLEQLREASRTAPVVLQRLVGNHPDIADLGARALCTVRIVTFIDPSSRRPYAVWSLFKVPGETAIVDNFDAGGLAAPVDLSTGVVGLAVRKGQNLTHVDLDRLPGSGRPITGRILPLWHELVALSLHAHGYFRQFPSVGWDVALSPAGPVLLEGNYNWDAAGTQQVGARPLGATDYPRHYFAWLGGAR